MSGDNVSAPLVPIAVGGPTRYEPLPAAEIRALVAGFDGASAGELAFGPSGIAPDGRAWVILIAPTEKAARLQRAAEQIRMIGWRWDVAPSCPFSLTLITRDRSRPQARWLGASDDPAVQAIRTHGQLYVCATHASGITSGWFDAGFVDGVAGTLRPGRLALDHIWTFPSPGLPGSRVGQRYDPRTDPRKTSDDEIPLWSEPVSDVWLTLGSKDRPWSSELDSRDRQTIAWARALHDKRALAAGFIQSINDRHALDGIASPLDLDGKWIAGGADVQALQALVDEQPELRRWLIDTGGPTPDAQRAHEAALALLRAPRALFATMAHFIHLLNRLPDERFREALAATMEAALLDARVTERGRCRPWLENVGNGELALRTMRLAPTCPSDDLEQLWRHGLEVNDLLDAGVWFGPADLPAPIQAVHQALEDVRLDGPVAAAFDKALQLLSEAHAARQWSIPWGARVDIQVGPFVALRIFEYRGEFSCLFLDEQDRYLHVALGLGQGTPALGPVRLVRRQPDTGELVWNEEAAVTLQLIAAAVVRDFLVVEEREQVFGAAQAKTRRGVRQSSDIVYLPRVRYTKIRSGALNEAEPEYAGRGRHSVGHHLRRAAHVSPGQRFLALRYNVTLPEGFTFVRPHERGGAAEETRNKVYRSRSASRMLFDEVAAPIGGGRPAWFQFEKDCAEVLRGAGMQVIHRATNRNGDGGVDLYAHDEGGDTWVVQCKCWSAERPVGVDVVRELVGAIAGADRGASRSSRGMIITTSTFTSGAVSEAIASGFKLIDGAKFAALACRQATT
jgi:hypothetical protein